MKLLSAWSYSAINILSGFIVLPLILTVFSDEETNLWFIFLTIVSLSELIVFGFNVTFSRFVSYTISGIPSKNFNKIKDNNQEDSTINVNEQLSEIFTINIFLFVILSFIYLIFIITIGYFSLSKPISLLEQNLTVWNAWYILIFGNFFRIITYVFPIFLQGMNKMTIYFNILSFQKIIYIVLAFIVLYFTPSLINMSIVMSIGILSASLLFIFYFYKLFNNIRITKFNKNLFFIIWDSAWKSGITKIFAPIIQHFSGLLFAQVSSASSSSSYLLTLRIFNLLQQFSDITFDTYVPKIAMLRSKNKFNDLSKLISKVCTLSYTIFSSGYIFLILFGSFLLSLIESNTSLAPPLILILFSIAYLLSRLGAYQLNLANQSNFVIEHKSILIYSILYFGFIIIYLKKLEMWVFPFAIIIAQLGTYFYTFRISYKLYNTTFFEAEKKSFIPVFLILIFFNLYYYWSI